jgi:hypothetical protein
MFDRIDETFKYDRPRQQAVVQALGWKSSFRPR